MDDFRCDFSKCLWNAFESTNDINLLRLYLRVQDSDGKFERNERHFLDNMGKE